jgi:hypothetical protein
MFERTPAYKGLPARVYPRHPEDVLKSVLNHLWEFRNKFGLSMPNSAALADAFACLLTDSFWLKELFSYQVFGSQQCLVDTCDRYSQNTFGISLKDSPRHLENNERFIHDAMCFIAVYCHHRNWTGFDCQKIIDVSIPKDYTHYQVVDRFNLYLLLEWFDLGIPFIKPSIFLDQYINNSVPIFEIELATDAIDVCKKVFIISHDRHQAELAKEFGLTALCHPLIVQESIYA